MYQERDREIIDYQLYPLESTNRLCRGPKPEHLKENQYFVCIGAAQTFGCFCRRPFPKILEEKLNLPVLNLGTAGAGPAYFLNNQSHLQYINKARFAVVQVMAARSESNSLFTTEGQPTATTQADNRQIRAEVAYKELLEKYSQDYAKKIVAESRKNWVDNYKKLLSEIKIPTILFWFSTRSKYYQEKYTDINSLLGRFPQLVNASMVKQIKSDSNDYVECVSSRGLPQLLISRFTYQPTVIHFPKEHGIQEAFNRYNSYYPSPEMHVDAAWKLEQVCRKYLKISSS